jgi:hypothetical protein
MRFCAARMRLSDVRIDASVSSANVPSGSGAAGVDVVDPPFIAFGIAHFRICGMGATRIAANTNAKKRSAVGRRHKLLSECKISL